MVRAKFRCIAIAPTDSDGSIQSITLEPVMSGSDENAEFFKYTPTGLIQIGTTNPAAAAQFVYGAEYYVDFTMVESSGEKS